MRIKTVDIVRASVIAAVYIALSVAFLPISFGMIQLRVPEMLCVLPALIPSAIPGLFIGCLISNIIGGFGIIDIVFGSLSTLLAAYLAYKLRKRIWLVPLPAVLVNAVVVGAYLTVILPPPLPGYLIMASYVGLGQIGACYVLGMPFLFILKKYAMKLFGPVV